MTIRTLQSFGPVDVIVDEEEARIIRDSWTRSMGGGSDPLLLKLSGRSYGTAGARVISRFVLAFSDRIVSADFSGILDGLKEDALALEVLELLVGSLQDSPIVSLNLSNMALGRDGILRLLQPLLSKNTLRELFLNNTGLGEDSMVVLSDILVHNQVRLEVIACSRNASDVGGAIHFATIIRQIKTLRDITYSECRPGMDGSEAIVDALKARGIHDERVASPTRITRLDLQGSFFPSEGGYFESLVAALKKLTALQYVNLFDCEIHASGREKIIRFLARTNSDMEIILGEEDDDSDDEEHIFEDFSQLQL